MDQPRAYLYRMANNHFLLHRRTAGRRSRREEDWVDAHFGSVREIDEEPSAEVRMIARQQVEMLQRAMDGLPERTRTIFQRFRLNGEPQRSIADDLQISVSAVEKHLARAYETVLSARRRFFDEDSKGVRSLRDGRGLHER